MIVLLMNERRGINVIQKSRKCKNPICVAEIASCLFQHPSGGDFLNLSSPALPPTYFYIRTLLLPLTGCQSLQLDSFCLIFSGPGFIIIPCLFLLSSTFLCLVEPFHQQLHMLKSLTSFQPPRFCFGKFPTLRRVARRVQ